MIPENVDYLFANTYKNFENVERTRAEYSASEHEVIYILGKYGYDEEKLGTCVEKEYLKGMEGASNEELVAHYKEILRHKSEGTKVEKLDREYVVTYSDFSDDILGMMQKELQYRTLIYKQRKRDKYYKIYGLNKVIGFEPTENMAKKNQDFMDYICASDFGRIIGADYLQDFEVHNWGDGVSYYTCLVLAYWYVIRMEPEVDNLELHLFGRIPEHFTFWEIVKRAYYALEGVRWSISQEEWITFLRQIVNARQYDVIDASRAYDIRGDLCANNWSMDQEQIKNQMDEQIKEIQIKAAYDKEELLDVCIKINKVFQGTDIELEKNVNEEDTKEGKREKKKIDNSLAKKKRGNISEMQFKEYLATTIVFWRMTIKKNPFISPVNIFKKRLELDKYYTVSLPTLISHNEEIEACMDEICSSISNVESCIMYKCDVDSVDSVMILREYEELVDAYFKFIRKIIDENGRVCSLSTKKVQFYLFEQLYAPYYLHIVSEELKCFMETRHLHDLKIFSEVFELLVKIVVMPYASLRVMLCEKIMHEWLIIEYNKYGPDKMNKIVKNLQKNINSYIDMYSEYEKEMLLKLEEILSESSKTKEENDDMYKWYEIEWKKRRREFDLDVTSGRSDDLYMNIYERLLTDFVKKRRSSNIYTR